MSSIRSYLQRKFKYDMFNRFCYKKVQNFPQIKKIVLNFGFKTNDFTSLVTSLFVLELLTKQKGILTLSKNANLFLKIRKGNPVGCKVTLQKKAAFSFLNRYYYEIFPKLKQSEHLLNLKMLNKNSFSYNLNDTSVFQELNNKYYLFGNLPQLNITIVTNSMFKLELVYLIKLFKFPCI